MCECCNRAAKQSQTIIAYAQPQGIPCVWFPLYMCVGVCVWGECVGVCVGHGQTDAGWHKKLVLCSRLDRPQHYVEYQRIFNVLCQFCFIMADKQAHSLLLFEQRRVAVAEGQGELEGGG